MSSVVGPAHLSAASKVRSLMATWAENEELIRLGAYKPGSNAGVDAAIARNDSIRAFRSQSVSDFTALRDSVKAMEGILNER